MTDTTWTKSRAVQVGEFYELEVGADLAASSRFNEDIAPTRVAQRTWNEWHIAALWVGMAICVPTYTLGGVLTTYFGLSVGEALWAVFIANVIVLIPLTLNAFGGTKFGIPFPVMLRSSFGIIGSNVPALIRALVACGWFGIQTLFGGIAVHLMLAAMFDSWAAARRRRRSHRLLHLLGRQRLGGAARLGVDQVAGGHRGAAADARGRGPAGLGLAAGFGERAAGAAARTGRRTPRSGATSSRASPRWWVSGRRCR